MRRGRWVLPAALLAAAPRFAHPQAAPSPLWVTGACVLVDSAGRSIAQTEKPQLCPVIRFHPDFFKLDPETQIFIAAHEVAHIRLGHTGGPDVEKVRGEERVADCFAAKILARLDSSAVERVVEQLQATGETRGSIKHPTGRERAILVRACAAGAAP